MGNESKNNNGLGVAMIATLAIGSFSLIINAAALAGICFLLTVVFFCLALIRGKKIKKENEKQAQIMAEQKRKQDERQEKIYASGQWPFPSAEFYAKCVASNLPDLNTSFSQKKATEIAKDILRRNNVPEKYYSLYTNSSILKEHFNKEDKIETEKKQKPQKAVLSNEESQRITHYADLIYKVGKSKREAMLTQLISLYDKKIANVKNAQASMMKLGSMVAMSASQTKTSSWATVAGIANGLAGPVAGVLAGAEAILQNAEIEEKNRQNRAEVNRVASGILSNSFSLGSDIYNLEKEKEYFIEAKENLRTKVVLDGTSTEELYQSIKIESSIRQGANGALIVSAALKTDYQPTGVPENVKICIDGTLHGQVYAGQVFVGAVTLPLPLFGVECGNNISGKTETLCPYYAINNQPYSVTWSPNRLWLMEV